MSTIIDQLRSRRSIRLFDKAPIAPETIESLKECLLRSPTSRGRNPWHFIIVDDHQLLQELSRAKISGSSFLAGAPLAFVICGDETVSDVWIEDCAIAAITLHYTAHTLGLGSCWVQVRLRDHDEACSSEAYLQQLLKLPAHIRVGSIVGIGVPAEEKPGHLADELPAGKFHQNSWGGET